MQKSGIGIMLLCTFAAALALLFHAVGTFPQPDNLSDPVFRLFQAVGSGELFSEIFVVRKYPILTLFLYTPFYVVIFAGLFVSGKVTDVDSAMTYVFTVPTEIYFTGRVVALVAGICSLLVMMKIMRRLQPETSPIWSVALLLSSIFFVAFSTAIRVHIFAMFSVLITVWASLCYVDVKNRRNAILAFGAATLSFMTLQNGLFSFIFPVWAYCMEDGHICWRQLLRYRLYLWIGLFVTGGFLIGYPFILRNFFGESLGLTYDLGHNFEEGGWTGRGFVALFRILITAEPLLTFTGIGSLIFFRRTLKSAHPFLNAIFMYGIIYMMVFGIYNGSDPRFFLPILPLLAIIGAPLLAKSRVLQTFLVLYIILVQGKMIYLAYVPNTFQRAHDFIIQETSGSILSEVPHYDLMIFPTKESIGEPTMSRQRFYLSHEQLQPARPFTYVHPDTFLREETFLSLSDISVSHADILVTKESELPYASDWEQCGAFSTGPADTRVHLWKMDEMKWILRDILQAKAMGHPVYVYCRK